jgi:ribonuclease VapC
MVIDSSAIVAMLLAEPERVQFFRLVGEATEPATSVASILECSIVMHRRAGAPGLAALDELIEGAGIRCVPVDLAQALAARRAWVRYGRGNSPAGLSRRAGRRRGRGSGCRGLRGGG